MRPPSIAVYVVSLNATEIVRGDGLKSLALLDFSIAFLLTRSTEADNVGVQSPSIAVDSISLNATEIYQC